MIQLPDMLRRAPKIIYVFALLMVIGSVILNYWETNLLQGGFADPGNPMFRYALFKGIYSASSDGIFLVANGMIAHIGIYIWDKMPEKSGEAE